MRKALVVMLAIALMAGAAWAQADNMLGPHNTNNTFGCQSCHAPHSQVMAGTGFYMWGLSVPQTTYTTYATPGSASFNASTMVSTDTTMNTVFCLSCHDQTFNAVMAGGQSNSPTTNMSTQITINNTHTNLLTVNGGVSGAVAGDLSSNHPTHVLYPNVAGAAVGSYDQTTAFRYWALKANSSSFVDAGTTYAYGHTARLFLNGANQAYIECGSCHNPHSQKVAVVSVNGVKSTVATAHFVRGEYDNTNTQVAFCVSCHADKSVAWNGTGAQ